MINTTTMNRKQSRPGTRNSQKANYKSGGNSRVSSRRPSLVPRRQSTQGSILPASDADGEVLAEGVEPLSETSPRALYRAPPGYEVQSLHYIRQYMEDTRMEENLRQLLRMLMERKKLPYNPYPGPRISTPSICREILQRFTQPRKN
ncbi:uncharacterized protein LOC124259254 [Haliotis rubra]|uniref:uncharacterized protein LOC124259254 n=1 Tax=Haliotis rubra TaxID=36100 RepID=UPI001EE56B92|nr:uncharacterized protein LOC124259254 [Haliotis rubra]